jgi:hypothetical protein
MSGKRRARAQRADQNAATVELNAWLEASLFKPRKPSKAMA